MTWRELLSDLAIIPAWECFLFGLLIGSFVTLVIVCMTTKGGDDDEGN